MSKRLGNRVLASFYALSLAVSPIANAATVTDSPANAANGTAGTPGDPGTDGGDGDPGVAASATAAGNSDTNNTATANGSNGGNGGNGGYGTPASASSTVSRLALPPPRAELTSTVSISPDSVASFQNGIAAFNSGCSVATTSSLFQSNAPNTAYRIRC